jgi:hypothetical protein
MIDLTSEEGLPGIPSVDDFTFKVGNDPQLASWTYAPPPGSITVRNGAGVNGAARITIIWPDGWIAKQWLQVTVKAGGNLGLADDYVFYFGNAIGDTGDNPGRASVDTTDEIDARADLKKNFMNPAGITNACDHNRDGKVDTTDEIITRKNGTTFLTELKLIVAP